jgi:hypothetical protein
MRTCEATGAFHSRKALVDAAEELRVAGFESRRLTVSMSSPLPMSCSGANYADPGDIQIAARRPFSDRDIAGTPGGRRQHFRLRCCGSNWVASSW